MLYDDTDTKEIPPFSDEQVEWISNALYFMPIGLAVLLFMDVFKTFNDPDYGSPNEVREVLRGRFLEIQSNLSGSSQDKAKARLAIEKNISLYFPLADPINRIEAYLELLYTTEDLTVSTEIKLLSAIGEEVQKMNAGQGFPNSSINSGWFGDEAEFPEPGEEPPFSLGSSKNDKSNNKNE